MSKPLTRKQRSERLIESMDRPLLMLAVVAMLLYLLDLHGMMRPVQVGYQFLMLLIDFVFLFDLVLKLRTFGREYLHTPWFLIDLLSCLPVLDVLANGVLPLRALRFIRGFRILRILRGLRVLRALRRIPAFDQLLKETPENEGSHRFHRSINIAMISITVLVLVIIVVVRRQIENQYANQIDSNLRASMDLDYLRVLGGSLSPPSESSYLTRTVKLGGKDQEVYFDLATVDERTNQIEFFLILGMLIAMMYLIYIIAYHQLDVTQTQLRALLNLALPKQVADQFMDNPWAYDRRCRMPAAILFMDFVGFSQTCEVLAEEPDLLAAHLEKAMDRLVGELVKHDLIIDKFIGDTVMSFRGGPLVGGTLAEHAYRAVRAALASVKALAELNDPYFHQIKIGGAASGVCLIGAFGTSARLSYTILGDGVNVAARLEPASAQCGTQNLFDGMVYDLCFGRPDLVWRRWGQIRVAGRSSPIMVYEVFDAHGPDDLGFIASFHRALEAFERNDFDRARDLFLLANAQRKGGDDPSRGYIGWCESLLLEGAPVGWEPVFETHK